MHMHIRGRGHQESQLKRIVPKTWRNQRKDRVSCTGWELSEQMLRALFRYVFVRDVCMCMCSCCGCVCIVVCAGTYYTGWELSEQMRWARFRYVFAGDVCMFICCGCVCIYVVAGTDYTCWEQSEQKMRRALFRCVFAGVVCMCDIVLLLRFVGHCVCVDIHTQYAFIHPHKHTRTRAHAHTHTHEKILIESQQRAKRVSVEVFCTVFFRQHVAFLWHVLLQIRVFDFPLCVYLHAYLHH